jgi:hypothetical protein
MERRVRSIVTDMERRVRSIVTEGFQRASAAWLGRFLPILLTSALVRPLFRLEYLNHWTSIESTSIADARMSFQDWDSRWSCSSSGGLEYNHSKR